MDQWTRPENPEREPHKYAQVNFDKGAKQFNKGSKLISKNDNKICRYLYFKKHFDI